MKPKVSVIIPVYKVEKYLGKCLESVEAQTYDNIEVILVDDGSPDNSGELCDRYASAHANTVVIHQSNQGQAVARNTGVKNSTGEYITFIDSDDYVTADYVEYLVELLCKFDADISVGQVVKFWKQKYPIEIIRKTDQQISLLASEAIEELCYTRKIRSYCYGKLYKREIVTHVPFPAGKIYEDVAVAYKMIGLAKRIAWGSGIVYYYRQTDVSTMRGQFSEKQWDGLKAVEEQLTYVKDHFPNAINGAYFKCASRINNYMFLLLKPSSENREVFKKLQIELHKYSEVVYQDRNVRRDFKIRCRAIEAGYLPMLIIYRLTILMSKMKNKRQYHKMIE